MSPAAWLVERLHPFAQDVGSVIPEGYEAYARVFHPAMGPDGKRRRWRDIAAANGRIVHPEMQLHMIDRPSGTRLPSDYRQRSGYDSGSLPVPERQILVEMLRSATSTPDGCWFCVWEGFGGLDDDGVDARVEVPGRRYLLAQGPIEMALADFVGFGSDQSPNVWWPEDRAWVVATEIDFAWTYVGGDRSVVSRILDDPGLEAIEAHIDHRFTHDSDYLNAALDAT